MEKKIVDDDTKLVKTKIWLDFGVDIGREERDCDTILIENTGVRIFTILNCLGVKKIMFSPGENMYIISRILSVIDNVQNNLEYASLEALSYEGLDIFKSENPKYVIKALPETNSITVSYYYEVISPQNSQKIRELICKNQGKNIIDQNKEKFLQAAIQELSQPIVERIPALKNEEHSGRIEDNYFSEYQGYKERYEAVINSTCWRVTKPLRDLGEILKGNSKKKEDNSVETIKQDVRTDVLKMDKPLIGVHLHLFYSDLLEEFCGYLNNIAQPFDLFISCKEGDSEDSILRTASQIQHVRKVEVKTTINRGRDIAPFYVLFRQELLKYKCLLHIHSKKSLYTGEEKAEWRHWALEGVLKNEEMVANTLKYLMNGTHGVGLIFGEMTNTLPLLAFHWLRNSNKGKKLCNRLNIKFDDGMFMYPVGSFFWARTDAIKPLFDLNLTYEDFDEEKGQIDATLAHALERIIACLVKSRGHQILIYDPEFEQFSINKSYKSFETYFTFTEKNIADMLLNFELVSFDIFDTLITRLLYKPDDIFKLMERLIYERYNKQVDFLTIRKEAELLAQNNEGASCNIHHIYECLPNVSEFTREEAEQLKELEIKLELELCIPREDSKKVFQRLTKAGRKVILVSDMYLPRDIIERILKKCGYEGYEDIWISCEKGKRKDDDTMWEEFFQVYGRYKTIHIGDNPHSDCQLVGDRKRTNMLWLSPRDQFRFSDQFEKYQRFIDTSVENSLMIGIMVNKCFYNSPFALKKQGVSSVNSIDVAAQGIFAPLFLRFCQFIEDSCDKERKLLFLAREGFFLQKLYKKYCSEFQKEEYENYYFLTSRRAASVSQICRYEDARELLQTSYVGKASTFLKERFGIENVQLEKDESIKLPGDERKVIAMLAKMVEPILKRAMEEKEAYYSYITGLLGTEPEWGKVTLVDVGYAGTIQYYLMKMLNQPLDGRYITTEYNVKPLALGGTCQSLYSFRTSKIFEFTQLFLEAVTSAPYGQLICFEKNKDDGQVHPVYKKEGESCWMSAQKLQNSIYDYLELVGNLLKDIHPQFSEELSETILSEVLRAGIFGQNLSGVFTVYDGYCMDGEWIYDEKETRWKLV